MPAGYVIGVTVVAVREPIYAALVFVVFALESWQTRAKYPVL
jgi:hypothetical protein